MHFMHFMDDLEPKSLHLARKILLSGRLVLKRHSRVFSLNIPASNLNPQIHLSLNLTACARHMTGKDVIQRGKLRAKLSNLL